MWQSPDPILHKYMDGNPNHGVFNPQNLGLYAYTANNPVNMVDPDGQFFWFAVGAAIAAYDAYGNYQEGGWEAVADGLAKDALITVATGGVGKVATKVATKAYDGYKATNAVKVIDKSYKEKIVGKAQKTGTNGHQFASYRKAIEEAKKPDVKGVYLDKGYNKALGLKPKSISPNRRPDVTSMYNDKTVKRFEVKSKTDSRNNLLERNDALDSDIRAQGYEPMPTQVIEPTRSK